MTIYIAGKITDLDYNLAFDTFARAGEHLRSIGHEPLNPMSLVDQRPDRTYNEQLIDALRHMLTADALFMLPNWRHSLGARIEHAIAVEKGLPIYYAASEIPNAQG